MGEKEELIQKIYENGQEVIRRVCEAKPDEEKANYSVTDCIIGTANTHLALKIAKEKGYPDEVIKYLEKHANDEQWHCSLHLGKPPKPYDFVIAQKHREILLKDGVMVWLGVMPLLGEKVALAKAICWRMKDDPHYVNPQAMADEYFHTTYPLILLMKYATEEELKKIIEYQKWYLDHVFKF